MSSVPTHEMVWVTNDQVKAAADVDGYNMRLEGDSFKRFIMRAATGSAFRGGNRKLAGMVDYSAEGITSIVCNYCGHPDDDERRLEADNIVCNYCGHPDDDERRLESINLERDIVASTEFRNFEAAICNSLINNGEYAGASGCRVAVSNCLEGGVDAAAAAPSFIVQDFRAAPKEGVLFVLENGN